jgi:sugar/nucleoside kinase (ribokinase family)
VPTPDHPIVPPLVAIDDEGNPNVFRSAGAAARYIPPIEIDIWEEYAWFDSQGRHLTICEDPPPREVRLGPLRLKLGEGRLVIRSLDPEPAHAAELAGLLRDWMRERDIGGTAGAPVATLARLIEIAIDECGFVA